MCIVDLKSKNANFYCWTENQAGRGSVEIGSALISFLNKLIIPQDINKLKLFCDGCGGQNKNSYIVHALIFWLLKNSPKHLLEIILTFPVRGHSYLPADRVFGRLEKRIKQHPIIVTKEEYAAHYSNFGKVHMLDEEWKLYNIKNLESSFQKVESIQSKKRIIIKKVQVRRKLECHVKTFRYYNYESGTEKFQNLIKKGKNYQSIKLTELKTGHVISEEKKKDVSKLLSNMYGEEWTSNPDLE